MTQTQRDTLELLEALNELGAHDVTLPDGTHVLFRAHVRLEHQASFSEATSGHENDDREHGDDLYAATGIRPEDLD